MQTVVIVGAVEFARYARRKLQGAGLRPVCARDGRDAVEAITHERPVMILIDGALPDIQSVWLLGRIERSPALARIPRAVIPRGAGRAVDDAIQAPFPYLARPVAPRMVVVR